MKTTRPWHSTAAAACLAAVAILAAACGTSSKTGAVTTTPSPSPAPPTCDPIYRALNLTDTQVQTRQQAGQCQEQDLNLTGEVTSHIRIGLLLNGVRCGPNNENVPRGTAFQFVEGTQLYTLTIEPDGVSGGVQDLPYSSLLSTQVYLENQVQLGSSQWRLKTGNVQVGPDRASGTVDAVLHRDAAGAAEVHLTGNWRCSK